MRENQEDKIIYNNKKAYHDFFIEQTFESGIVLKGYEVKSIRKNGFNIKDSYCKIKNGEIYLIGSHISKYFFESEEQDTTRDRKLLLKRKEINKLIGKIQEKGYSLVPTKTYFKKGLVKLEIALAKGKQLHDKRKSIKEKEQKREIERIMKVRG